MDCKLIEPALMGFHFGTLDEEVRVAVEAHLPTCGACLGGFLSIKRGVERGGGPLPSPALRARLRRDVLREFGPARRRQRLLYVAMGSALATAAMALLVLLHNGVPHPASGPAASAPILDSARPVAANLDYL